MKRKQCPHNRRRYKCAECRGGGICEHNRCRSACKECGGSQICMHNRMKSQCKKCGGSSICKHNRRRSTCKECACAVFVHGQNINEMRKIDLLVELEMMKVMKVSQMKIGQLRTTLRDARQTKPLRKRKRTGRMKTVVAKRKILPRETLRTEDTEVTYIQDFEIIASCVRI